MPIIAHRQSLEARVADLERRVHDLEQMTSSLTHEAPQQEG